MGYVTSTDIHGNKYQVLADKLVWRPSAYGIIIRDGQILLTQQYKKFMLPGGGIELGETPEQAVIREVKEETGFDVRLPKFVEIQSSFFSYQEGDHMCHLQTLLMFFVCELAGGKASMEGFDPGEQLVGGMPQWFDIKKLDEINTAGTFDWRSIVEHAL
jgi:8-oxo-dGTP diphosphatase